MKAIKRFLSVVLAFTLLFGVVPMFNTEEAHAQEETIEGYKWVVYEQSLLNCYRTNFGGKISDSFSLGDDASSKPSVKNNIGSGDTYYTADGKISIKVKASAQTCELTLFSYGGVCDTLYLTLPDSIVFVYCNNSVRNSEAKSTEYSCIHSEDTYITSLGTAFRGTNYVTNNTNTFLHLTVPERVTTLNDSTFEKNTKLKSIKFKGAIQTMGKSVFSGCINLSNLDLANLYSAMNTIPDKSFYMCSQLENISIPDTILNIGNESFYQCDKIDYLILSNKIKSIGKNAFAMCSNMRYIYVPSNYQDWTTIVDSTETSKIVTTKSVVVNQDINSLVCDSGIYGGEYYIHSGVDMSTAEVRVDGNLVEVEEYFNPTTKIKGFSFTAENKGTYTITGTDLAGNELEIELDYSMNMKDKKAPEIIYNNKTVSGTKYFNKKTSINVLDKGVGIKSVKVNSKTYKCNNKKAWSLKLKKDGEYKVTAVDAQGNSKTVTIILDTSKPKVSGIRNGGSYIGTQYITYSDKGTGLKRIKLNGVTQRVENTQLIVSEKRVHTLVIVDKANNKTTVKFKIHD